MSLTPTTIYGALNKPHNDNYQTIYDYLNLLDPDASGVIVAYGYSPVTVASMKDGTAAPAALDDATTRTPYVYRDFDDAVDEDLNFVWPVPDDLIGSVVQFRVSALVTNATGPTGEGVAFGLSGASMGNNDPSNATKGTVVVVTTGLITAVQHDLLITDWSGDVTITDLAAGEIAEINLLRDVSDVVDTYAQDVGIFMVEIRYTKKATK